MKGIIQARKEKPGEFCGTLKRYPKQAALNLLAEGYTVYSDDQGINRSSAMTYLLQRALFAINVRIMLHENKKMEVIK